MSLIFVFALLALKGRNTSAGEAPRHIIIVETGHALSLQGRNTYKTPSNRHCGLDPQSHMCGTIKLIDGFVSSLSYENVRATLRKKTQNNFRKVYRK